MRNEYAGLLIKAYFSRISACLDSTTICVYKSVCLCVSHQQQ